MDSTSSMDGMMDGMRNVHGMISMNGTWKLRKNIPVYSSNTINSINSMDGMADMESLT